MRNKLYEMNMLRGLQWLLMPINCETLKSPYPQICVLFVENVHIRHKLLPKADDVLKHIRARSLKWASKGGPQLQLCLLRVEWLDVTLMISLWWMQESCSNLEQAAKMQMVLLCVAAVRAAGAGRANSNKTQNYCHQLCQERGKKAQGDVLEHALI